MMLGDFEGEGGASGGAASALTAKAEINSNERIGAVDFSAIDCSELYFS